MANIVKSEAEWRQQLTAEQFEVTRRKGTEAPFSGAYYACQKAGIYACVCCGRRLFASGDKFDSGTGWPSFRAPYDDQAVRIQTDRSHGLMRSEVLCGDCNAHLGHVFPDGPLPGGERYCINSVALTLQEKP